MLFSFYAPLSDPGRNATVLRIWGASIHRAKKALAIIGVCDDVVAVRHDLPHMPSLGVSSLDSRPPWRHGGLLFLRVPDLFSICALRSLVLQRTIRRRSSTRARFIRPPDGPLPDCPVPAPAPSPRPTDPPVTRAIVLFGRSSAHRGRAPGRSQSEPHGPGRRERRNAR